MKKLIIPVIVLIISKGGLSAQGTFQRLVYSNSLITNTNMNSANNGEFMITGTLNPNLDYISAALLDKNGNTKWSKYYNDRVNSFADARATQTKDSGFVIVSGSLTTSYTSVLKIDKLGNLVWSEYLGGDSLFFYPYRIITGDDGGVLISGRSGGAAFILKLNDANGKILWAKTFIGMGGRKNFSDGSILGITSNNDGGYVVSGYWEYFDSAKNLLDATFIAKFSNAGNYGGSKFYNTDAELIAATKADAGNYIFTGNNLGRAIYIKSNDKGNIIWAKQIMNNDNVGPISIVANANGTHTFMGQNYFANINNDGSLNWYKNPKHYTRLNFAGLCKTTDGGYASISKKFASRTDTAFIIKVDENGNTCHGSTAQNYTITNIQMQPAALTGDATDVTTRVKITPSKFKAVNKTFFNELFCSDQLNDINQTKQNNSVASKAGHNLQVSILSNPVNNILNCQIKNVQSTLINIAITNIQGNIFYTQKFTATTTVQYKTIDVAALMPGMYVLKISDGQQQQFVKFVKN